MSLNPLRQLLKSSGAQAPLGTWIMAASPLVTEAMGHAGFQWGVIDMEHTPLDMMEVIQLLQAAGNIGASPTLPSVNVDLKARARVAFAISYGF